MIRAAVLLLLAVSACSKGDGGSAKLDQSHNIDETGIAVKKLAFEAYPQWAAGHPDIACPHQLPDLLEYVSKEVTATDAWGHPYTMMCGANLPPGAVGLAILSAGPDGKEGTADDIKSWK